ncbi:MAG: nucleoside triphosphate pyrophosphohydrolase [Patescibacteria group bacterium]|nr:nucleoside triphosphate pyrophosphohydrolase [Patescibacteria group bacterium]MDD4610910.1 nucleoside triphosphate pyrophosphohydrolase [Patescibacteria group bacterium]
MKKIYNKLVRDRIPEIIEKRGAKCKIKKLTPKRYKEELFKKVLEEASELVSARKNKEDVMREIGDVYEVIEAVIKVCGLDKKEIKKLQTKRAKERGRFKKKLFLISTIEN